MTMMRSKLFILPGVPHIIIYLRRDTEKKNCQMSPAVIEDTEMHEKILVKKWYIPSSM